MPINTGLSSCTTHELGERGIHHGESIRASMVLSRIDAGDQWDKNFTLPEVLSSILRIFIFPFSFAFRIESMSVDVFWVRKGSPL